MRRDGIFRLRFLLVSLLAVLLLSPRMISAGEIRGKGLVISPFDAPVLPLDNEKYFYTLIDRIRGAKDDITLSMYLFKTTNSAKNLSNGIMHELMAAAKRGVAVEVILEESGRKNDSLNASNRATAKRLMEGGVKVRFDSRGKISHSKLVVIDRRIVFIGSHNFSHTALSESNEASLMIESEGLARYFLDYLEGIK